LAELSQDAPKPYEHIAETGKVACRRLGQNHSAGAAACASADAPGLKNHD
jgi:hypothetical protein